MSGRDLDVVVFGTTGITGRQVAAHLAQRASEEQLSWAAAARDPEKSAKVLGEIGVQAPQTLRADVSDPDSLLAMASGARVVLNLVGPYTRYGRPVVEACVSGGAHYIDLTGEMPFVRRTIDEFDEPAKAGGVKVVNTCGFESLPADLLVALVRDSARERFEEPIVQADLEAAIAPPPGRPRASDTISGGTLQSVVAIAGDKDAARAADPAALISEGEIAEVVRRVSPIELAPRRGEGGAVLAPMAPAAFINPAVIHRSAQLDASARGEDFTPLRYREGVALRGSPASLGLRFGVAGVLAATQVGLRGMTRASPAMRQRLADGLGKIVPASGFGPTAERLEGWRWTMSVRARTTSGRECSARAEGDGHPGYLSTARMLGEAGIVLSREGPALQGGGCLTPAIALGSASTERLERAGVRFSLGD
ncbi:MAG: hypothetical protein E6G34_14725 [Actinobacteria bacterium]|nr:MAG: hypothetical protein E6G34_14725 [Actinomycetota bacterium]